MTDTAFVISPTGQHLSACEALVNGAARQGWRCASCRQSVHLRQVKRKTVVVTHLDGTPGCTQKGTQSTDIRLAKRALHALAQAWQIPVPLPADSAQRPKWSLGERVVERAALIRLSGQEAAVLLVQTYVRVLLVVLASGDFKEKRSTELGLALANATSKWRLSVLQVTVLGHAWNDLSAAFSSEFCGAKWLTPAPRQAREDSKWRLFDLVCSEAEQVYARVENRQGAHYNLVVPQTLRQLSQDMRAYVIANRMPARVASILLAWRSVPDTLDEYGQPLRVFEQHVDTRPEQVTLAWLYFRTCLHGLHSKGLRWTEETMATKLAGDVVAQSRFSSDEPGEDIQDISHNAEVIAQEGVADSRGLNTASALQQCIYLMLSHGYLQRDERNPDELVSQVSLR